jgi:DNA repair exonuclease SbcCD ATPase subunit
MDIAKKNDFIVKHKNPMFFEKDLELFKKHCPDSRLHANLKRVNSWNKHILCGQMLYELLDKVAPEVVIKNRETTSEPPADEKTAELAKKEAELKAKEDELAKKETELAKMKSELEGEGFDLEEKESELEVKETKLDDKEIELDDKEAELDDKEAELAKKEAELKTKPVSKKKASTKNSPG